MTKVESKPDGLVPPRISGRMKRLLIATSWLPSVAAVAIASYLIFVFHRNEVQLATLNERLVSERKQLEIVEKQREREVSRLETAQRTLAEKQELIDALEKKIASLVAREQELRKAAESRDPEIAIRKVREQLANGTGGQRADLLARNGWDAFKRGDLGLAESLFAEATKEDASFAPAYTGLGRVAAERHDLNTAERYYLMAVRVDPRYAHGWYNLAHLNVLLKKYEKAREYILRTLEVDPEYKEAPGLQRKIEAKIAESAPR